MLLLGCSSVGREQDGEQGSGVHQKGVADGDTSGAVVTSQAGCVFGELSLRQGLNLHGGSLWHVWKYLHTFSVWEKGKGSGSVLFWSWPRKVRR